MQELSAEYDRSAAVLKERILELEGIMPTLTDKEEICQMEWRLHTLWVMWRETRNVAVLTARYYERGYRRNARYTL